MPFLTQAKTNWKFLLVVIVLAVIVGGGILAWRYWLKEEIEPPKDLRTYSIEEASEELERSLITDSGFTGISYNKKEGMITIYLENEKAKEKVPDFFRGFSVQKIVTGSIKAE